MIYTLFHLPTFSSQGGKRQATKITMMYVCVLCNITDKKVCRTVDCAVGRYVLHVLPKMLLFKEHITTEGRQGLFYSSVKSFTCMFLEVPIIGCPVIVSDSLHIASVIMSFRMSSYSWLTF